MAQAKRATPLSFGAALRHESICTTLEASGRVSIPDLAERLGVTAVTIREDLKHLERRGVLTRVRGGAVVTPGQEKESALELTSMTNREEKHGIAGYAASLIKNGHTVVIDVGSTTTALAKALSPDLQDVVVITNGLNIAMSLESAPGVSVIVTGGTLRPLQHSLVAPMGTLILDQLRADIAFIGCNGVDVDRGFTNANIAEAEIKRAMLASARYAVFLADHDKIGKVASAFVADVHEADLLITDRRANIEVLEALQECGLETVVVDPVH